jgi:argininosuccinate lyase
MDINEVFRSGGHSLEFLHWINKASIVMLSETGIIAPALAAKIARGIAAVIERDRASAPQRSADYLDYEPRLIAEVGPEASRLHTGRSRQDLSSTIARMNLRAGLLELIDASLTVRAKLLALAGEHIETIIPAYTHGVQAQPTTFAHFLAAYLGALARATERLRQAYERVNRSPLGSAALATSSFALDRMRLAQLLGFESLVENAYDANHLASVDAYLDVAGALAIIAVQASMFAQDIHAQYDDPKPWFMLASGKLTGVSSIMPQKRNPAALEQLRAQASILLGEMQGVYLLAHNLRSGMFDYRMYDPVPAERGLQMLALFAQVIDGIVVDKDRALAEVQADYSTTTEIADALLQRAAVPFRIGHHFASKLTDFGRANHLRLSEIAFDDVLRIYAQDTQQTLPLSEIEFREVISARYMVFGRRGRGGPQPAEVARMLADEDRCVAADRTWFEQRLKRRDQAASELDQAFDRLCAK